MKILHTADWHLGKKLAGRARLGEQADAIAEIAEIADREAVDVVILAGDVFDAYNPSAEAEELFYASAVRLAKNRVFVALAGNHDDADRLAAPDALARSCGVVLCGRNDLTGIRTACVTGGPNSLVIEKNGRLNLAVLPYPTESRLDKSERYDSYADMVRALLARGAACFGQGFDMVAAHIFTAGCSVSEGDERMLGSAFIVDPSVIPACRYAALGHVHKPMTVSKSRRIEYSGSILNYHFGDETKKTVVLIDADTGAYRRVPLSAGKPLVRVRAAEWKEAVEKLEGIDGFAELTYTGEPLKPSEYAAVRACKSFAGIRIEAERRETAFDRRAAMSDRELFEAFYKEKCGPVDDRVTELFLRLLGGEDVTA